MGKLKEDGRSTMTRPESANKLRFLAPYAGACHFGDMSEDTRCYPLPSLFRAASFG
jgi:hypothetical protein